jgi:hypothetical protein
MRGRESTLAPVFPHSLQLNSFVHFTGFAGPGDASGAEHKTAPNEAAGVAQGNKLRLKTSQ